MPSEFLNYLIDGLEQDLNDFSTWLPDALRRDAGLTSLSMLKDTVTELYDAVLREGGNNE